MFSEVRRYGFINAKLKTRLSLLLPPDFFARLSRSPNLTEAMILLKDTEYAGAEAAYRTTGDLKMSELSLLSSEIEVLTGIQRHVDGPVKDFVNALILRYETENLKQALRLWFDKTVRGRDISVESGYMLKKPVLSRLPLDAVLGARNFDELVQAFPEGPSRALLLANREKVETTKSLFSVEIALDIRFYRELKDAAACLSDKDRDIINRLIGVEIDLENITRLMRFHYFYKFDPDLISRYSLPGGLRIKPGLLEQTAHSPDEAFSRLAASGYASLSALGTAKSEAGSPFARMELIGGLLDEILKKEISRMLGGDPFTIGIILSYFILKRQEIRRISSILNGVYYRLPEDRMRRLYT